MLYVEVGGNYNVLSELHLYRVHGFGQLGNLVPMCTSVGQVL